MVLPLKSFNITAMLPFICIVPYLVGIAFLNNPNKKASCTCQWRHHYYFNCFSSRLKLQDFLKVNYLNKLGNVYHSVPSYGDKYGHSLLKVINLHRLFDGGWVGFWLCFSHCKGYFWLLIGLPGAALPKNIS